MIITDIDSMLDAMTNTGAGPKLRHALTSEDIIAVPSGFHVAYADELMRRYENSDMSDEEARIYARFIHLLPMKVIKLQCEELERAFELQLKYGLPAFTSQACMLAKFTGATMFSSDPYIRGVCDSENIPCVVDVNL